MMTVTTDPACAWPGTSKWLRSCANTLLQMRRGSCHDGDWDTNRPSVQRLRPALVSSLPSGNAQRLMEHLEYRIGTLAFTAKWRTGEARCIYTRHHIFRLEIVSDFVSWNACRKRLAC